MNDSSGIERWLRNVRSGDRSSLASLLEHYRPRLRRMVAIRMDPRMSARADPSDVLQEVFLDANRQLASYVKAPEASFYVWLRGLACQRLSNLHRRHLGAQRRAALRDVRLPADSSAMLVRQLADHGPSPSGEAALRELQRCLRNALSELKPEDREVIVMRHFEGLTNRETSEVLGLHDSAATMRYGRALARLRDKLLNALAEDQYDL